MSILTHSRFANLQPGQTSKNYIMRFEHVAINVADIHAVVDWYTKHLGLHVVRAVAQPPFMTFLADAGKNMMFEFYQQDAPVSDYAAMHPNTLHIAFVVEDIEAERDRLVAAGGVAEGDIATTVAGDKLAFVRDPWGLTLQLVMRSTPMLP
jgi:catechol 2,3-dioxygenase-like lactoylglutathione lyase family enzyme